jgi:hypothetical protein
MIAVKVVAGKSSGTRRAVALACVLALTPGVADAANRFTIDANPDSLGAIATDRAGDGYITWEHQTMGLAASVPMFCKLPPGATSCANPIELALPEAAFGEVANAQQVFPILGPGSVVWVVTGRYVGGDTLIWTSTDGGDSFGAAHEIPYVPTCAPAARYCIPSFSWADKNDIDDVLPVTPSLTTYERQTYLTGGQPSVSWLESSNNPGLGFNISNTAETLGGPAGLSEFTFSNPGPGVVTGSTLGTTGSGDVVEAYWLDDKPPEIGYYAYLRPNSHGITPQTGWTGPGFVAQGYLPRLASGARGLFMASADGSSTAPATIDVRRFDEATQSFGAPQQLGDSGQSLYRGGGIGENVSTGELGVVWPTFTQRADVMRLFLSDDGGRRFSPALPIAGVEGGYIAFDNARVSISDNGTGFVTFWDGRGLQVASLMPTASQFGRLTVGGGSVAVPVTCPAPRRPCTVRIQMTQIGFGAVAKGTFRMRPGATSNVRVRVTGPGAAKLAAAGGRLTTDFLMKLSVPGAPPYSVRARATLVG